MNLRFKRGETLDIEEKNYYSQLLDVKKHYDNIYSTLINTESGNEYFRNIPDEFICRYLDYIPRGNVLEIGIGNGKNIDFLIQHDFSIEGVDISEVAINNLKHKYHNCTFISSDIMEFNIKSNYYSLIICSMTLSYLDDINKTILINRIKEGLINNGVVFISTLSPDDPVFSIDREGFTGKTLEYLKFNHTHTGKKDMINYFKDFETIQLNDAYLKEPSRLTGGYYGLMFYIGRKVEIG